MTKKLTKEISSAIENLSAAIVDSDDPSDAVLELFAVLPDAVASTPGHVWDLVDETQKEQSLTCEALASELSRRVSKLQDAPTTSYAFSVPLARVAGAFQLDLPDRLDALVGGTHALKLEMPGG